MKTFVLLAVAALANGCSRKEPAPPPPLQDLTRGKANVSSSPAGAAIEVGGSPTGAATPAAVTIEVGKDNIIGVHRTGYLPATKVVNPDLNQTPSVHFELLPGAPVSVTSDPAGAQVWLADRLQIPSTPGTVEALPVGAHVLRFKKEGFADTSQSLQISSNEPVSVSVKLPPASYLKVDTEPDGAEVYVDGSKAGVTSAATRLALIANVRHRVEVRKEGFATATKIVPPRRAGETSEVSFHLQEVRLINVRARLKALESDLRKWTAMRDKFERKQEGTFVIRDARKELAFKRKFEEASDQVESITAEIESAEEQLEALQEAGANERAVKTPK
jgi:hypothetical protein